MRAKTPPGEDTRANLLFNTFGSVAFLGECRAP